MGKAILMSIRPQYVAKILNGEKTIEVRKKFPKDYVGWVYIYCTKGKPYLKQCEHFRVLSNTEIGNKGYYLNGKVVAKFWCDKVEEIHCGVHYEPEVDIGIAVLPEFTCEEYSTETLSHFDLLKKACLADYTLPYLPHDNELNHYLKSKNGYAIHISKVEVFDKPKELKEFKVKGFERIKVLGSPYGDLDSVAYHYYKKPILKPLERAPQSWHL